MITAHGLFQRSSKWVGSRLDSFSRSRASLLLRDYSFCRSLPFQSNHLQFPKCTKAESGCSATLSIADISRRCVLGLTAEVLREPHPRTLLFDIETRANFMEPSSHRADLEPAEGFARHLWDASQREAYCALYHPFVVALAGGTLHIGAFQKYIAQDVFFLAAFAQAYGHAIENTDDQEASVILQGLKHHVQDELDQVHLAEATADSSGLELNTANQPNPATTAYTDFLFGVATGDAQLQNFDVSAVVRRRQMAAYTIAAMTPCARLYAFLGQQISKALGGNTRTNAYSRWIDTYASTDFGCTAVQSEYLVHRLAMPFPGEIDEDAMERLYRHAMELEVGFFAAQQPFSANGPILVPLFLSEMASKSHFVLFSDFDSTCTVSDSCPVLADLSVSTLERGITTGGSTVSSVRSLRSRWDSLVDQYSQEHAQLLDRLLSSEEASAPESPKRPYNPELVRRVLEEVAEFEITANARVVHSGVLAGLHVADVKQWGVRIPLREGCKGLLGRISEGSLPFDFHVLSVCWSRLFMEGSFMEAGLQPANIYSNELQFDDSGISTGNILTRIQTALDKEKVFIDILSRTEEKLSSKRAFTLYVGDSLTDLLCLLRADIGIVIGKSSSLERVAAACGITFLPLYSGLLQQQQGQLARAEQVGTWSKVDGVLYRISSWHELDAFLLGR